MLYIKKITIVKLRYWSRGVGLLQTKEDVIKKVSNTRNEELV